MSRFSKKIAAAASVVAMALSSLAVAVPAFAVTHAVGTNVKSADGTVWMIMPGNCRRAYTSEGAFLSYGFNSFAAVVDANADDLALPVCSEGFIPPQDGSLILSDRGADKGTVYVISNGKKFGFPTETVLFGQGYNYGTHVKSGDLSWMAMGGVINNASDAHLPGSVVNNSGTVQFVDNDGLRGFPTEGVFYSWGYDFSKVVPANAADKAKTQVTVLSDRMPGYLSPTGSGTATPPAQGTGSYTASLASDNPASGTLVQGQGVADLAHFTINGTGTITQLKFKRIGVSADATLSNVYVFQGSNRVTDSASVASGYITFTGLNMSASGTTNISIKSDIAGSSSGQTVGVQLVAINGTDLGSMPSGNTHTIASATLATVAVASASGTFTDPGNDINVWQGTVTVGNRNVTFNRLSLRQIGSIASADIKNFRLQVDGVQVATASSLDSNGYVTFTPGTTLNSGSRTVRVLADVVGGSSRTVQMSLRGAYDINTTDTQYGVGVLATGTFPFGPSASTVASGTLSIIKASDSPSANVVACASDVVVGKWTFTAYGESVKVETLSVGVDTNGIDANATFRNGRVLVDGSQVGSTTDIAAVNSAATGQSFTTNFYVNPGTPRTVEVRADMYDSEGTEEICGTATFTSAQFALVAGSSNAIPQTSLTPISVPAANVNANALTIATGSISLAANPTYPNQSVTTPQTAFKIGSFNLSGNSSEAVNVNTLTLDVTVTDNTGGNGLTASVADVTDVYIKYGSSQTTIKSTVSATGNTYSVNIEVPVNGSMTFDVYANLGSDIAATDTVLSKLLVSGVTTSSSSSVSTNSGSTLSGQTITSAAGSMAATLDASTPNAQLVDDTGTVTTAAFKFAAVTDSYTITDMTVTLGSATAVSSVALKDGSTTLATKLGATSMAFSGLNISVPANTSKVITVEVTMNTIGVGAGTTDSSLVTTLGQYTFRNSNGTSTTYVETLTCGTDTDCTAADDGTDVAGNAAYAYKAIPLVSVVALPTSALVAGTNRVIAKFTVSSNGTGTIAWKQVMLEIAKPGGGTDADSSTPTITSPTLWDADSGTQITAATSFQNANGSSATTCAESDSSCEILITVGTVADDDTVQSVSGAKTYEVRATIGGNLASGDYISATLDRNTSSYANSAVFTSNDNAGNGTANSVSFVWSDESASATGNTGVATWQKDYLIKNLPVSWNLNY